MAARAGFEPTTLRSKSVVSTNKPPCPTNTIIQATTSEEGLAQEGPYVAARVGFEQVCDLADARRQTYHRATTPMLTCTKNCS